MNLILNKLTDRLNIVTFSITNDIAKELDKVYNKHHTIVSLKRYLDNKDGVTYLTSGSSRLVYKIDNYAIKIAKNKKGIAQNETEADWSLQQLGIVPKLYEVSEDYMYIIVELCSKCKKSDFEKIEHISFQDFCNCLEYYHSQHEPRYYKNRQIRKPEMYDESWNKEDSLLRSMYDYIGNYEIPVGDLLRLTNYGINSKNEIVLVDSGLNENVYKKHYENK